MLPGVSLDLYNNKSLALGKKKFKIFYQYYKMLCTHHVYTHEFNTLVRVVRY